jgi:hypothetical protein
MNRAHIVTPDGHRLGREELEARIAIALAEAQSVLAPGILSSLISNLVAQHEQRSRG